MILFEKIRWKNFLSTGNAFTEINLNESTTTLIIGENGAGKSTILDALCFSLYGKPFRKIKKDQLINSVNNKDVLVEIEFTTNNKKYLIRRGIKPTIFEVYQNDELIDQDAASRDYQEALEKNILKMNMKTFTQVVILGSSSFIPFMQLVPATRREIIEDLLDIKIFSSMSLLLKDKIATNKENYLLNEKDIKTTETAIKIQENVRTQEKERKDTKIKELNKNVELLKHRIANTESIIVKQQLKISDLIDSCDDYQEAITKQQKLINFESNLESKRKTANKVISFYTENDSCPTCTQAIDLNLKQQKISEKEKVIEEINDGLNKLEDRRLDIEKQISEIIKKQKEIQKEQDAVRELQSSIKMDQKTITIWNKEIENVTKEVFIDNQDELRNLSKQLNELLSEKKTLLNYYELFDLASIILKDSGIKAKIIKQYIPVINVLVNKYLASMDFFVKFELDETFEEKILSRHRDVFSYSSFSEGEKMRIDLALLFTWRAIAKMKNSASTNLLILDEVFDASLDANGCDEFLKIINEQDKNTNTFVISHRSNVMQDKFTQTIKFEKIKNFSVIRSD